MIKALIKANRFIRTSREGSIRSRVDRMGTNHERKCQCVLRFHGHGFQSNGSIPDEGLRLVLEQAKEGAKLSREISAADVADLTILRRAQKELAAQVK